MSRHPVRRHWTCFTTATRYALIEHLRNRFATVLVALFVPVWTVMGFLSVPDALVRFRLRATGETLTPGGNQLTEITGVLNSVALIIGFMMFAATFTGSHFDRRLVLSGYPRVHLVLAKVTALTVASVVVAAYATGLTCVFRVPDQPLTFAAALFCAGLTYGALGVALGSLLHREVEGMFAIAMISIIDLVLQNPLYSSSSSSSAMRYLPSYGSMQAATGAGFSTTASLNRYLAIQLLWFTVAACVGFVAFQLRTRSSLTRSGPRRLVPKRPARSSTRTTTPGPRSDVATRGRRHGERP
ncbi:ABC transporter permease [Streptomyces sp. NPDC127068]|uniref:ABC transporter permease n=1 Tax=Streptomyces sp. NPDC127068 TaxID=3347127 RepID=UPI003650FBE4